MFRNGDDANPHQERFSKLTGGIGTTDTLMGEGVAALLIGLLHWRYLYKEKLRKDHELLMTDEQHRCRRFRGSQRSEVRRRKSEVRDTGSRARIQESNGQG